MAEKRSGWVRALKIVFWCLFAIVAVPTAYIMADEYPKLIQAISYGVIAALANFWIRSSLDDATRPLAKSLSTIQYEIESLRYEIQQLNHQVAALERRRIGEPDSY